MKTQDMAKGLVETEDSKVYRIKLELLRIHTQLIYATAADLSEMVEVLIEMEVWFDVDFPRYKDALAEAN